MKKIVISDIIGLFVEPYQIRKQLEEANGEDIVVEISTPGGLFSAGLEIFNMLKNYSGNVSMHLMGMVASMGTYIAMARGKNGRITAEDNAVFMIHNAQSYISGDQNDLRKRANILESLSGILARKYEERTGQELKTIQAWMDEETYFFGQEILEAGFVDEIIVTEGGKDKTAALAIAKTAYTDCITAVAKSEKAFADLENIAAQNLLETGSGNNGEGQNQSMKQDDKGRFINMDLNQLIKDDPGIAAQVAARDAEKFEAGKTAATEGITAKIKRVSPFLTSTSVYPAAVRDLAVNVLNGEKGIDALDGAVTVIDAQIQIAASQAAANETAATGETTGDAGAGLSEDGSINSAADYNNAVKELNAAMGRGGE